jgi:methionyl-tRNA formyltransferase
MNRILETPRRHQVEKMASPLRILVVTEDDPIYVIKFFEAFFLEIPKSELSIIGLTVDRAFHEPLYRTLRRIMRLYGWTGTCRQGLRFLRARLGGRSIEALARRNNVPLLPTVSVNSADYLARVRELQPDAIISVAGAEIFSPELLSLPRLGCLNIHSGRLPTYRGMLPTFWQMRHGEPEVTITVHRMVERLDAGDVLATAKFPIRPADSLDRVIRRTKRLGARLFVQALLDLRAGTIKSVPLDMGDARYFGFPGPDDVRAFKQRGHRLI